MTKRICVIVTLAVLAALLVALTPPLAGPAQAGGSGGGRYRLHHDSHDDLFRTPTGAVPTGTTVTLRLGAGTGTLQSVTLRLWDALAEKQTMLPMTVGATQPTGYSGPYDLWEVSFEVGNTPTLYWYRFIIVTDEGETRFYEDNNRTDEGVYFPADEGGPGSQYPASPDLSWQLTVYDPAYQTPQWMQNAVVYQVFPDRFRNGDLTNDPADGSPTFYDGQAAIFHETWNEPPIDPRQPGQYEGRWNLDFFGGDLAGVIEKLDYLASLGVTAIYLNPIFAANSNHRYDTVDFKAIDPLLGDMETFRTLVAEAEARGMVVILDGVFNHTSSDSVYFDRYGRYEDDGACESLDSIYRNWFIFVPPSGPEPSVCVDTPTGATFYESWAGVDTLPRINSDRPEPRLFFYIGRNSVASFWGQEGIGGWRLDVASDIDSGPASDYWEGFRVAVHNKNPEGVIIGEEWGNASRWLLGDEWDSVMNYRLRRAILGFALGSDFTDDDSKDDNVIHALLPSQVDAYIRDIASDYPPQANAAMMNILGSHDVSRVSYVLGDDPDRQRLAALLQFALPGAPTIFYGDEIALDAPSQPDGSGIIKDDPYNRAPYPWPDEEGDTYAIDEDMLAYYQALGALRRDNPALRTGELITLLTDDVHGLYVFLRLDRASGNAVLVALNNSDDPQVQTATVVLAGLIPQDATLEPVFGGDALWNVFGADVISLPPLSGNAWTFSREEPLVAPPPPQNVQAQGENGGVILTWDAVPGARGYAVYRSPVATGGFELVRISYEDGYIDESTINGFKYFYRVASVSQDKLWGEMGKPHVAIPSAPITEAFDLMGEMPDSITYGYGVTLEARAAVRIEGQTEAPGAAFGVRAEAGLVPPGADDVLEWVPMSYQDEFDGADTYAAMLDVPPQAGEGWQVRVRFSSNAGETWSLVVLEDGTFPAFEIVAPEDQTAPDAPPSAEIVQASLVGVIVGWELSSSEDTLVYRVYRTFEDETRLVAEVAADAEPRYEDRAVAQGSSYTYAVSAVDAALNESEPVPAGEATVQRNTVPVTFNVTVPDYTGEGGGGLFIAGDFGTDALPFWDPAGIPMEQVDDQHWTVTLEIPEGARVQYKYVRGAWTAVEKGPECEEIANRTVDVTAGATDLQTDDLIAKWRDLDNCP